MTYIPGGDTWNVSLTTLVENAPIYENYNRTAIATANGVSYVQNNIPKINSKWYVELFVEYSNSASDAYRVGVIGSNSAVSVDFDNTFIGDDINSIAFTAKGDVIHQNYIGNAFPYSSGNTICIACDFDINRVWFRTNDGPWADEENTANSISDPILQLGGSDISAMIGQEKFIGAMLANGSSVTISVLNYTPPTGFTPWLNPQSFANATGTVELTLSASGVMFSGDYYANSTDSLTLSANGSIFSFNPYDVIFPINPYGAQARVNIFDIPQVIHLVLTESYVSEPVLMNYPINRTDFRLIRGVPNTIQFFVRDVDSHIAAGPLANATLTINIVDQNAQQVLLQRDLFVVNSATSLYGLSTQPVDMLYWPTGPLQYSVLVARQDGTQSLLWTDKNYSPYSYCIMTDGPLPGPAVPMTLDPTTFTLIDGYSYSSPVPGAASLGYPDGLQSFSFYANSFTGRISIQGTLIEQPSSELSNWFDITYQDFMASNGVTAVSVEGNYMWLRAVLPTTELVSYPNLAPALTPTGNITQILYLN